MFDKKLPDASCLTVFNRINLDDSAFEIFFKENFSMLCSFCQFKFEFDIDAAKEVAHSSFIKVWESRNIISPDLSVKAYLYKIATNISYDMIRHDKVKRKHEKYVFENLPFRGNKNDFDPSELSELKNNIDKAVAELPAQMRKIFELSRYEGLKYSEISSLLTISVKTVETQMSRALVKLRHKLANYLTFYCIAFLVISFS